MIPLARLRLGLAAPRQPLRPRGARGGQTRALATTALRRTDGVFRGLADDRLPMPWIEAFRMQKAGKGTVSSEAQPQQRDLSPRKMSGSYHRVVLPLGQDPWLSDQYLNSSGHIRFVGARRCAGDLHQRLQAGVLEIMTDRVSQVGHNIHGLGCLVCKIDDAAETPPPSSHTHTRLRFLLTE